MLGFSFLNWGKCSLRALFLPAVFTIGNLAIKALKLMQFCKTREGLAGQASLVLNAFVNGFLQNKIGIAVNKTLYNF